MRRLLSRLRLSRDAWSLLVLVWVTASLCIALEGLGTALGWSRLAAALSAALVAGAASFAAGLLVLRRRHGVGPTQRLLRSTVQDHRVQQGAESPYLAELCTQLGIDAVMGECILMHAQPTGIHRVHRALEGLLGRLPA